MLLLSAELQFRRRPRLPLRLRYLVRVVGTLARAMGLPTATVAGRALARAIFGLNPPARPRVEANLLRAFGTSMSGAQAERIACLTFEHAAAFWAEAVHCGRLLRPGSLHQYVNVPAREQWQALAVPASGRPCLLVTGYVGNPVVGACALSELCPPVAVLVDPLASALLEGERHVLRRFRNLEVIATRDAGRRVPPLLEAGGRLILLAGRRAVGGGVSASFLGSATPRSASIARLAHRHGADLVVFACRRLEGKPFRFELEWVGRVVTPAGPVGARAITGQYLALLEGAVRKYPEQFLWTSL
jgi:lauroyl/myristoyl acyltransferase